MTDNKYFSRSDNQYTFAKQRASIQNEISAWAYLDKKPDMPEFPPNSKLTVNTNEHCRSNKRILVYL